MEWSRPRNENVTVESGADGRIHAIRLNDRARRANPDELAATIAQAHNAALDQARTAVTDAIARLESDPHIQAARRTITAALNET
ncbi:YbaB/EbfC family nucleoid-associated protein [Nocardia sp. CA2R105]|uniref:YbaB/EbfC family nucleoid-associated protein n=1 Tax=Nocardia coffeae TaxID=2873381 RepID=UPI001CA7302E|nr:YbaB/EbfC family nucleoid-associated protein [Nocardia coffeae]